MGGETSEEDQLSPTAKKKGRGKKISSFPNGLKLKKDGFRCLERRGSKKSPCWTGGKDRNKA